jgi:hypothetical protein
MIIPSTSLFNRRILRFPLQPLPVLVGKNGAGANAKHRNPIRLVAYLTPSDWYTLGAASGNLAATALLTKMLAGRMLVDDER